MNGVAIFIAGILSGLGVSRDTDFWLVEWALRSMSLWHGFLPLASWGISWCVPAGARRGGDSKFGIGQGMTVVWLCTGGGMGRREGCFVNRRYESWRWFFVLVCAACSSPGDQNAHPAPVRSSQATPKTGQPEQKQRPEATDVNAVSKNAASKVTVQAASTGLYLWTG